MANIDTMDHQKWLPRLSGRIPSEGLLEDMAVALQTILTVITETDELIYTTGTVILEVLGYKLNVSKGL